MRAATARAGHAPLRREGTATSSRPSTASSSSSMPGLKPSSSRSRYGIVKAARRVDRGSHGMSLPIAPSMRAFSGDPLGCTAAVRPFLRTLALALALLAGLAPARAAAQPPTAASLHAEVAALLDTTAAQWAGMVTPDRRVPEPVRRRTSQSATTRSSRRCSPTRSHRAGQRTGNPRPRRRGRAHLAAGRSTPSSASSFDMLGAAYAYRTLALSDARRAQLASYTSAYGDPARRPPLPAAPALLGEPEAGRRARRAVDHRRRHRLAGPGGAARQPRRRPRGRDRTSSTSASPRSPTTRSARRIGRRPAERHGAVRPAGGPARLPRAHHVHAARGGRAARAGGLPLRAPRGGARRLDALSVLVSPDGDTSYLGRGQGQTWVPALAAARARRRGARRRGHPARAAPAATSRGAQRAVRRLVALHASPQGLQLVPGARRRAPRPPGSTPTPTRSPTTAWRCSGSRRRSTRWRRSRPAPIGRLPADGRLARARRARQRARRRRQRPGLARRAQDGDRRERPAPRLRRARAQAPHPRPAGSTCSRRGRSPRSRPTRSGPALIHLGQPLKPTGFGIHAHGRTIIVNGGYRANAQIVRRVAVPLAPDPARRAAARRAARSRAIASGCSPSRPPARAARAARAASPPARAGASTGGSASAGSPATIPARSSTWTRSRRGSPLRGPGASPCDRKLSRFRTSWVRTTLSLPDAADRRCPPPRDLMLCRLRRLTLALAACLAAAGRRPRVHDRHERPEDRHVAGPALPAARHPPGAAARVLRLGPRAATSARYDQWMTTAHARGADVLLTINQHSRHPSRAADARASTGASCGSCASATRG